MAATPNRCTLLTALLVASSAAAVSAQDYTLLELNVGERVEVDVDVDRLRQAIDPSTVTLTPTPTTAEVTYVAGATFAIRAVAEGDEEVDLRYCDATGACDTAYFAIIAELDRPASEGPVYDTVAVPGTVKTLCVDTTWLPGTVVSVRDLCAEAPRSYVEFTLTERTACVKYRGIEIGGTDTTCIEVCDDLGVCDTTTVIVTTDSVAALEPQEFAYTIERGLSDRHVLDVSAFALRPDVLENLCAAASGQYVGFSLDPAALEVRFEGIEVGTERACVVARAADGTSQEFGITVNVVVEDPTLDTLRAPVAVDDEFALAASGSGRFDVLANDTTFGVLTSVTIVAAPTLGVAVIDEGGSVEYVRDAGAECRNDRLVYEICNALGCDRATVTLRPTCEGTDGRGPIRVTQSLSPNDDGIGDAWVIENIRDYPDNEVKVYNRWGARVYAETGYENDWRGTFQDGKPLPDGTYFYVVVIEGAKAASSYLELRR